MLTVVTAAILPIILNVAVGYLLAWRGFLDSHFLARFSGVTFRFFIPCLLFTSIYQADITLLRLAQYWSGYFIPILGFFVLLSFFTRPLFALSTVYANTVMVGIPLVVQTWGDAGLNIAVAVISLNSLTLFMAYALLSSTLGRGGQRSRIVQEIGHTLTNPIILSLVAGASLNLLHAPIYGPLVEAAALPGRAALPCSLLILGATLASFPLRIGGDTQWRVALICLCSLLLIPAGVLFFAGSVLHLDALTTGVLVLLAACPCGVNVLPFAQKSDADRQVVSAAIFVSTVAAVATLPLWVYWVR
ncbi:MAG: AEC family transporter [Caldilineaceae bacterium]